MMIEKIILRSDLTTEIIDLLISKKATVAEAEDSIAHVRYHLSRHASFTPVVRQNELMSIKNCHEGDSR
jgi:hypothetical protein